MRPTTYTKDMLKKARQYVKDCPDEIPTVVGLCHVINRSKSTVYNWAADKDKLEFLDIVETIGEMQEKKLILGGLNQLYSPTMAKLLLCKHGYSEKQEVDHTSSDSSMAHQVTFITPDANNSTE